MNKIILFIAAAAMALSACSNQKPSERVRGGAASQAASTRKVAYTKAHADATPEIQVTMNGVPFKMLWDTGATGTTISQQELNQLIKDGAVSDSDVQGYGQFTVADGSTLTAPVISIRSLTIATDGEPFEVNNVTVAVMPNPTSSMLLGQNVMNELPKYTFNEVTQNIEFEDE